MERGTKISYIFLGAFTLDVIANYFLVEALSESTPVIAVQFLGLILFILFVGSLLVNIFTYIRHKKPGDIWKLGFIGLLGFLGFIPSFGFSFFGLYGFYGFFGLKKQK